MTQSLQLLDSKSTMFVHVFSLSLSLSLYLSMPWLLFFQNLRRFCASICVYNETVLSLNFHPKKRRIFFSFIPARGIRILIIKILAVELNYSIERPFRGQNIRGTLDCYIFSFFLPLQHYFSESLWALCILC
jgi:hypothetical protein